MEKAEAGKYKLICFTDEGKKRMEILLEKLKEAEEISAWKIEDAVSLGDFTGESFKKGNVLIFIGATAIAVRAIAPYIKDKETDPAVLVIDEKGTFVIPVLSGHLGGANEYAGMIADIIGAIPVITTATDIRGEFAVDVFAKKNGLEINDMKLAKKFTAKLLSGEEAVFTVSPRTHKGGGLCLIPKCLVVGMGCRKGKSFDELLAFLTEVFSENNLEIRSVKALVSIDIKEKEEGLRELAKYLQVPFLTYSAKNLMAAEGEFEASDFVLERTGADNICERAAAVYGVEKFLVKKTSKEGMTIAVGLSAKNREDE